MPRPLRRLCTAGLLVSLTLGLARCETSFDVYEGSDAYFSIFGYLDAAADTQWIRVEALQDSLLAGTGRLDAEVTLADLGSGRAWSLHDSLFRYFGGAEAYNFWTPEAIRPRGTYRLTVRRSDGATSSAEAVLPDTFPAPTYSLPPFSFPYECVMELTVRGVERLAALEVWYYVPEAFRDRVVAFPVSYLDAATPVPDGFLVAIRWGEDLQAIGELGVPGSALLDLRAMRIRIGSAGPTWPEDVDLETAALPDVVTNVENGVGFLGGAISRTVEVPLGPAREASCL